MNERLKLLRKTLGLTQQGFADQLHIKRGTVAKYETGANVPMDAVLSLICREFHVSESWIRTGEGEMFEESSGSDEIEFFLRDLPKGSFKRKFIKMQTKLNEKDWKTLEKISELLREEC